MRRTATTTIAAVIGVLALSVVPGSAASSAAGGASGSVITHILPAGGSASACLAPMIAKLKQGYPLHKETQSLSTMESELKAHLCHGISTVLRQLPSTTTQGAVSGSVVSGTTSSACVNCFRVYSYQVCDGWIGSGCFVNGYSTNWSESFVIRFEYRDKHWVECSIGENRTRFPGTWMSTSDVHTPLWGINPYWVGSVWDFARAYHNPDYVLARDEFQVLFGLSWFHESWNCRTWMNAYPRGYVLPGFVGSPS